LPPVVKVKVHKHRHHVPRVDLRRGGSPLRWLMRHGTQDDRCLADIIDVEDGSWDPTIDYGGGHYNTHDSYGLGQANPGTKMSAYGADYATNALTQLRWMRSYVMRYGGACPARNFRYANGSY